MRAVASIAKLGDGRKVKGVEQRRLAYDAGEVQIGNSDLKIENDRLFQWALGHDRAGTSEYFRQASKEAGVGSCSDCGSAGPGSRFLASEVARAAEPADGPTQPADGAAQRPRRARRAAIRIFRSAGFTNRGQRPSRRAPER